MISISRKPTAARPGTSSTACAFGEIGPSGFTVAIENASPVSRFLITLFGPGNLQAVHCLARQGPDVWGYYGLAGAGESMPSLLGIGEASYANRAEALYRHFVGDSKDCEPPPRA